MNVKMKALPVLCGLMMLWTGLHAVELKDVRLSGEVFVDAQYQDPGKFSWTDKPSTRVLPVSAMLNLGLQVNEKAGVYGTIGLDTSRIFIEEGYIRLFETSPVRLEAGKLRSVFGKWFSEEADRNQVYYRPMIKSYDLSRLFLPETVHAPAYARARNGVGLSAGSASLNGRLTITEPGFGIDNDVTARVGTRLGFLGGTEIGASLSLPNMGNTVEQIDYASGDKVVSFTDRHAYGVDVKYENSVVTFIGEYILDEQSEQLDYYTDWLTSVKVNSTVIDCRQRGYYGEVQLRPLADKSFAVIAQYDYWDPDTDLDRDVSRSVPISSGWWVTRYTGNDTVERYTLGIQKDIMPDVVLHVLCQMYRNTFTKSSDGGMHDPYRYDIVGQLDTTVVHAILTARF